MDVNVEHSLALIIPAATLVNAIGLHIVPTLLQHRVSPGVYTAALLYVPFSSWAFVEAWRHGVPKPAMAVGLLLGTCLMLSAVLAMRLIGGPVRTVVGALALIRALTTISV